MAALGGYFAVSYLAEHAVSDALDATWRVLWRDATGAVPCQRWSTTRKAFMSSGQPIMWNVFFAW
jgi:hypothetical protein